MRYRRADVVDRAVGMLDRVGLDGLTMRKLAAELGVQPGALYHHFTNKDALLAAVADELLTRGRRATEIVTWDAELRLVCVELRDAMLACRDGATLLARVHALGLSEVDPEQRMYDVLQRAAADDDVARIGARTLLHFVVGHVSEEQVARPEPRSAAAAAAPESGDFHLGLSLVLDGLRQRLR